MSNQAAQELQAYVRRVESVEDEINVLNQDKSAIYKEAKANGFNTKTLRKVIAARRLDETERQEQDAEFELYWNAIHGIEPDLVRAHVENIEEFDAETGEITEPQVAPQPAQGSDEAAEPVASQPIQPETANEFGGHAADVQNPNDGGENEDAAQPAVDSFGRRPFDVIENSSEERSNDLEAVTPSAQIVTEEGAHIASVTPIRPAKQFRPLCLNRERCGASGPKECWKCLKAAEQGSAA